jgi:hypothetical protein
MNKKETQIIKTIKNYLIEGEEYKAKNFAFEYMDYIQDTRSKQFDEEYARLECEIDWTPSQYETDYEYNRQMDRISDDPWKGY